MAFTWAGLTNPINNEEYEEIQNNLDYIDNNLSCISDNTVYNAEDYTTNNPSIHSGYNAEDYTTNNPSIHSGYDASDDLGVLVSNNGTDNPDDNITIRDGENVGHDSDDHYGHKSIEDSLNWTSKHGDFCNTADVIICSNV